MSLAEIDSRHYPVQSESPLFDFGLELDANTPALTSTSPSNVGQSPYLHQHPSTPQELPSGNSYFYSPAQTPYNLTGSPAGDYRNYSINVSISFFQSFGCGEGVCLTCLKYELGYPQSGMFMKEEDIMLLVCDL
jgi:hypothetical protein